MECSGPFTDPDGVYELDRFDKILRFPVPPDSWFLFNCSRPIQTYNVNTNQDIQTHDLGLLSLMCWPLGGVD